MGLPKNFNETVNFNKRLESLNDLTFYHFTYDLHFTEKFIEEIYTNEESYNNIENFLGAVKFNGSRTAEGENRVSALTLSEAENKLNKWLGKAIESEMISGFNIKKVKENSFNKELEELGLYHMISDND
jgi:hypothetical protein